MRKMNVVRHVRANVPARGGEMRNDLCFPGGRISLRTLKRSEAVSSGLTPAAISFEKLLGAFASHASA